jgi:hypothetical protein
VPIASDVDCAGGDGNGPAYTTGPVQVIGTDIYELERDLPSDSLKSSRSHGVQARAPPATRKEALNDS